MYEIIGQNTGKRYVTAKQANDCLRKLQQEYPYFNHGKKVLERKVYPEPLLIRKIVRSETRG